MRYLTGLRIDSVPYTDASDYGLGGVLSQVRDGEEVVIAYYSKALNPAQHKYCTTRKERYLGGSGLFHKVY